MSIRKTTALAIAAAVVAIAPTQAAGPDAQAAQGLTAGDALLRLIEGNARFVNQACQHPHLTSERVMQTANEGQFPFCTVISCSDSRVPVEQVFDCGIGDVFTIRVAGNVVQTDEAGSIEYGVAHLGTPLLVVMGHTSCGAVTAVADKAEVHGNIPALVAPINEAVNECRADHADKQGGEFVNLAVRYNVYQQIENLLTKSEDTRKLVADGKLKVVGAVYDLHTGAVEWLGGHPQQQALLDSGSSGYAAKPAQFRAPQATAPTYNSNGH